MEAIIRDGSTGSAPDGAGKADRARLLLASRSQENHETVGHVCVLGSEKAAWFRDTEGNYLCLHQDGG
jgi:hypothetical protein